MRRTAKFNNMPQIFARPRNRQLRKQKAEDLRDLGKIAVVLAIIAVGYFEFAPGDPKNSNEIVAVARN